jgi:ribosomal protein S27E
MTSCTHQRMGSWWPCNFGADEIRACSDCDYCEKRKAQPMYVTCPSCTNSTGWRQSDGSIRCIPCGRGLVPKGTPTLDKEDSKRAADFLSGKTNKFERTGK